MNQRQKAVHALKTAFPKTIPVFAAYWFLALAYGIYMGSEGFSWLYPTLMAVFIYGGSLEFVTVTLLLSPFAPVQAFILAFIIQARHIFYSIAMLDKYRDCGIKKYYMIYSLSDETFAVNYSSYIPEHCDRGWFYFWVSLLDQFYWVGGAAMGGLIGSVITLNTTGLDFVMTAMFVCIFIDQLLKESKHYSAVIGIAASLVCLYFFGADNFLIPTMISIIVILTLLRKPIEAGINEDLKKESRKKGERT